MQQSAAGSTPARLKSPQAAGPRDMRPPRNFGWHVGSETSSDGFGFLNQGHEVGRVDAEPARRPGRGRRSAIARNFTLPFHMRRPPSNAVVIFLQVTAGSYHWSWRAWWMFRSATGLASQPTPKPYQRFTPRSPASHAI
jgi:hypothetical protein